jgi:ligand-binding sensor domain-containing protein
MKFCCFFKTFRIKFIWIFIAGFCSIPLLQAQDNNIRFERITSENYKVEKGLSVNSINCILQDSRGYMWFGTWDGLNKYDGYTFKVYRSNYLEEDNQLTNQTIQALCEDHEGNLWIGTASGLNKYDYKKHSFTQYYSDSKRGSLSNDTIWSIYEDSYNNLWIGTQKGLNLFNKTNENFTSFLYDPKNTNTLSNNKINDIYEDNMGCIWISTNKGLNRYNLLNKTFTRYFSDKNNPQSLSSDTINSVVLDKTGIIWIGTQNGLCAYSIQKNIFKTYKTSSKKGSISHNTITDIYTDKGGQIWVGTQGGGINKYNPLTDSFEQYKNQVNNDNSLSNDQISCIFEDQSGILWVATYKGVNKIDKTSSKFNHFKHIENDGLSLNSNTVWAFSEDYYNNIWIGTDNGLNMFTPLTGKFNYYTKNVRDKNSISSNSIRSILTDRDGTIWVGTLDAGLDEFVKQGTTSYIKINHNFSSESKLAISGNCVWCLREDNTGLIWIGTNNGLNCFDKTKNKIITYENKLRNPYSLSNNIINVIFQDKEGYIWVGTWDGLNRFDKKTGKFKIFRHIPGDPQSISSNCVFGLFQDATGKIWIGTMGGGLNVYDPKTGLFKTYTEKDGLPSNMVYCILEDKLGNLWLSTNNGISKFNIATETFVNYDIRDGIQSSEFNQNAAFLSSSGEMFFGGMDGFNSFFPKNIIQNKFIPPIVITGFKVFNEIQKRELYNNDTIILSHYDNFFSFEFSSLDYSNPYKNKYAYKLERFDKDWIFCDANHRFAEFTKVSPGTYVFRVKGTNSDGLWNDKGISVVVIIRSPWWVSWWFRIPVILFMILLSIFLINRRFQLLRKKHKIEKKMLDFEKDLFELEQKALRLQMNPHFIFNSLNSIQNFIIKNDSDKAIFYLSKFAQLMRLILSNSSQSFVAVKDEIKVITYYLDIEKLRFENKFEYHIDIDPEIDDEFFGIPPMIIQPFVENAIIHGMLQKEGKGRIYISLVKASENLLFCVIEDNGIGREKAMEIKNQSGMKHKSRGMLITKERLDILNQQNKSQTTVNIIDLKDSAGNATGTRVEIMIPVKDL